MDIKPCGISLHYRSVVSKHRSKSIRSNIYVKTFSQIDNSVKIRIPKIEIKRSELNSGNKVKKCSENFYDNDLR